MNAITITTESLRAALAHLRDKACEANDEGAYYAGGIDAITALLPMGTPARATQMEGAASITATNGIDPVGTPPAEPVRPLAGTPAPRPPVTYALDPPVWLRAGGAPLTDMSIEAMQTQGRTARPAATMGPAAASLEEEDAQPAHADTIAADPPITIPPLPAGPGSAVDPAPSTPAAEAGAPPAVPPPAPPPVLAAGGNPSPEAHHAPPGDAPAARPPRAAPGSQTDLHADREAAFRAAWPDPAYTLATITAALNATPGPTITNDSALYKIARALGLPKRSEFFTRAPEPLDLPPISEFDQVAPAPRQAPAAPPPVDARTAKAWAGSPGKGAILPAETDTKREVFDAFDGGMTVRDAEAEFGLGLSTLSNLHAEWRLKRRTAEAAE